MLRSRFELHEFLNRNKDRRLEKNCKKDEECCALIKLM